MPGGSTSSNRIEHLLEAAPPVAFRERIHHIHDAANAACRVEQAGKCALHSFDGRHRRGAHLVSHAVELGADLVHHVRYDAVPDDLVLHVAEETGHGVDLRFHAVEHCPELVGEPRLDALVEALGEL